MSAQLYPGIKSLHLVLDRPYDTIRTDDVRDDLVGVKVWYSTTSGFDPKLEQGTLAFDGGAGLSVVISELEVNTQYYVKYAYISAIDPSVYTISSELTAVVYDESTTVYGYLTNDPTNVPTDSEGGGGNFSLSTQGTFKVWNLTQDVTGQGVVYAIKPNSATGGLQATISPTTGDYYATGMTDDISLVVFTATYNNVVIEKVWNVNKSRAGVDGTSAVSLRLSGSATTFVYKDDFASTSVSGNITITSSLQHITGTPEYSALAYTRAGVLLGAVEFSIVGSDISISSVQFNPTAYNNTVGYVTVTATLGGISDTFTINRVNDGSEQITVEQSNSTHTIAAYEDGTVPTANYAGSGNIIKVLQGSTYLVVDNNSPYSPGSWRITDIVSVGITADPTPTIGSDYENFDAHSAMTADTAYIDYTITGLTTTSKPFVITVRQSFSKSKAGVAGSNAPVVTLTATSQAFIVAKNTGTVAPLGSTLTATPSNMTSPTYAWTVDGVLQEGQTAQTFLLLSFTGAPKLIRVDVTSGSTTVFDQMTIFSLKEGDDALQAALTNENQTISCDSTGTPLAGQLPATSKMIVAQGATILSSGVVFSKVSETNLTSTIGAFTGNISVTAITANAGTATYRATIGSTTIDKVLTINKTLNGAQGATGAAGSTGPLIDISGFGTFYRSSGGALSPTTMTLGAVATNITSPSFTWTVSGATPASGTGSSITVTPNAGAGSITVSLSVTGSNITGTLTTSRTISIVDQGAPGQAGSNGMMSAFPTIYIWTNSATPPTRPTVASTYTWATGAYTAPAGWDTIAPNNTSEGSYLWSITVPLSVVATVTSSALDWTNTTYPIRSVAYNGINASPVLNGTRTAVLDMYLWSFGVPALFPSGSSTFTWATNTFTAPATTNGWSLTPPPAVAGQTLYVARQVYSDALATTTSAINWDTNSASPFTDVLTTGTRTAVLDMYKWSAAAPTTFPVGSSTYTWASDTYTAPATLNGWSLTPPAPVAGQTLYVVRTYYSDSLTATTTAITWTATSSTPYSDLVTTGYTRATVLELYKWSATTPTTYPTGSSTYTWSTGSFTLPATANGWSKNPGQATAGQKLYVVRQYYGDALSATTSSVTWAAATSSAIDTVLTTTRAAFIELYTWSATTPSAFPSGTSVYTWADGTFTLPGTLSNGSGGTWAKNPGQALAGTTLWGCKVTVSNNTTVTSTSVTWPASNSAYNIASGVAGPAGAAGSSGSATFLVTRAANDSSAPTVAEVTAAIGRAAVAGDICTISYNSANNSTAYRYTTSWVLQTSYLTGDLIVTGTVSATKLTAKTISADRIIANNIATSAQFTAQAQVTGTVPYGTSPDLSLSNTSLVGSFTVSNTSNVDAKYVATGVGRSGMIYANYDATKPVQNFGVVDSTFTTLYFTYGWSPCDQDAKGFVFTFTLPAGTSKTFQIRATANDVSGVDPSNPMYLALYMNVVVSGVYN